MHGYLSRYEASDRGVFGIMVWGDLVLQTVERPWLNNVRNESCIPAGAYELVPFTRHKGDNTYALINESLGVTKYEEHDSSRFAILIHAGNTIKDVIGCVAPGLSRDGFAVRNSQDAMGLLLTELAGADKHTLTIEWGQV